MIDKKIKTAISEIKFPETDIYHEKNSADGYAFLGCAKEKVELDSTDCYELVKSSNFCLNKSQKIRGGEVPANTMYVYTMWPCIEFLNLRKDQKNVSMLMDTLDKIGRYPNGMMRYCTTEINYIVPNVTSCAALLYALDGQIEKTKDLVSVLLKEQKDGNWRYYDALTGEPLRWEDSFHLAMIVYHLREIQNKIQIDTQNIIARSLEKLKAVNRKSLDPGSIGWGIPMLYAATKNLDSDLSERAFVRTLEESLVHENFRVRAYAAWALTKEF